MDLQQANDFYSKVSHMTFAQKKSFHQYTLELVHGSLKNDDGHKEKQISQALNFRCVDSLKFYMTLFWCIFFSEKWFANFHY